MILAMFLALAATQSISAPPIADPNAARPARPPRPKPLGNVADWVTRGDYPAVSLRERQSGVVGFTLDVDAAGVPTACDVTSRSGSAALDEATCALLIQRARFAPGLDAAKRPVATQWTSRIRWELPTPAPTATLTPIILPSRAQSKVGASDVTVNADGIIEKCEPVPRPFDNVLGPPDICSTYPAGARFSAPAIREGRPQRRRIRITITTNDTYLK